MPPDRSPINRVLGAIVPRAVGAVDPDALIDRVDVEAVVERIDIDALIERVDVDGIIRRVDIDNLLTRIDVDALMERIDIGALLDRVDMDGLIRRVDLNAVLAEIDVDALIARIDVDALVGRLDVDALMARVDVDALLRRVDMPALIARTGIDDIVSQAATGMATRTLDMARRQLVGLDTVLLGLVDRVMRRGPGTAAAAVATPAAVTGRPAGPMSRLAAFAVDWALITVLFSVSVALGSSLVELFTNRTVEASRGGGAIWGAVFTTWAFLYLWVSLAVTGRTVGKALVGLRVIANRDGALGPLGAAVRTVVLPVSFVLGLGFVPAVLGRNRRALHDYAGGSREVVDWGARTAALPSPLERWLTSHGAGPTQPATAADADLTDPVAPTLTIAPEPATHTG